MIILISIRVTEMFAQEFSNSWISLEPDNMQLVPRWLPLDNSHPDSPTIPSPPNKFPSEDYPNSHPDNSHTE